MPENPTLYQLAQLGVEVTAGTAVAATKRLTTLEVTQSIKPEIKVYRPSGYKFSTIAAMSKEWTELELSGPVTYNEVMYLLNGMIKTVTPSGVGADKTSTFSPSSTGSDTRKTYTLELGSADRARQIAYCLMTGLDFTFNRKEVTCKGTMIGKAITDGFTMTALTSAAEIPIEPVLATQGYIKFADTYAGLAGATAAARAFAATWSMSNVSGPVWPINASNSWSAMVDTVPTVEGTVKMAVDAEGMALLTNMRAGSTKYMRIHYSGPVLGVGTYQFRIDVAMKVKDVKPFSDEDGVYAVEWNYEVVHDSTWGKAYEFMIVNALAAL